MPYDRVSGVSLAGSCRVQGAPVGQLLSPPEISGAMLPGFTLIGTTEAEYDAQTHG